MPGSQSTRPDAAAATAWSAGRPPFRADHVGSLLRPPDLLAARDELCLSPQCGFSSSKEGNDLTARQQWDKFGLIVETAQEVWGTW